MPANQRPQPFDMKATVRALIAELQRVAGKPQAGAGQPENVRVTFVVPPRALQAQGRAQTTRPTAEQRVERVARQRAGGTDREGMWLRQQRLQAGYFDSYTPSGLYRGARQQQVFGAAGGVGRRALAGGGAVAGVANLALQGATFMQDMLPQIIAIIKPFIREAVANLAGNDAGKMVADALAAASAKISDEVSAQLSKLAAVSEAGSSTYAALKGRVALQGSKADLSDAGAIAMREFQLAAENERMNTARRRIDGAQFNEAIGENALAAIKKVVADATAATMQQMVGGKG